MQRIRPHSGHISHRPGENDERPIPHYEGAPIQTYARGGAHRQGGGGMGWASGAGGIPFTGWNAASMATNPSDILGGLLGPKTAMGLAKKLGQQNTNMQGARRGGRMRRTSFVNAPSAREAEETDDEFSYGGRRRRKSQHADLRAHGGKSKPRADKRARGGAAPMQYGAYSGPGRLEQAEHVREMAGPPRARPRPAKRPGNYGYHHGAGQEPGESHVPSRLARGGVASRRRPDEAVHHTHHVIHHDARNLTNDDIDAMREAGGGNVHVAHMVHHLRDDAFADGGSVSPQTGGFTPGMQNFADETLNAMSFGALGPPSGFSPDMQKFADEYLNLMTFGALEPMLSSGSGGQKVSVPFGPAVGGPQELTLNPSGAAQSGPDVHMPTMNMPISPAGAEGLISRGAPTFANSALSGAGALRR